MRPEPLSIVILTFNSDKYLEEVLQSASFADETLILDGGSTDATLSLAEKANVTVYKQKEWLGFGKQKQKAVDLAKNDWVFVLDSDEVISGDLQKEILSALTAQDADGYTVPRLNHFFGKPIRHGGLYPDATIRLFNRKKGDFTPAEVHEKVIIKGRVGQLHTPMKHYAYDSIEEFIDKQNRYSTLGAKPNRLKALFNPIWTFLKMYGIKQGFRDGWHGYLIARLYSQYTFWKYIKDK
jgi:glycosyltransferase involved in cell wall biosynthesis